MFLNGYPYTDFHEMNLDFLLKSMETLKQAFADFTASNSLIFAEPLQHDLTESYAKNTIVLDPDGNAYISLQAVPEGVQLSNGEYWLMVFNFEDYTEKANKNFTNNYFRDTDRTPYALSIGDWVVLNDVLYTVIQAIAADGLLIVGTNLTHFTVEQFLKDFVTSVNQTLNNWYIQMTGTIQQYKNDIDASELAYRQQLAQDIADTTASLQAQLDTAISGATVDSEVILARVGYNGQTFNTLGDAIRSQIDYNFSYDNMIVHEYELTQAGTSTAFVRQGDDVIVYLDNNSVARNLFIYPLEGTEPYTQISTGYGKVYHFTPVKDGYIDFYPTTGTITGRIIVHSRYDDSNDFVNNTILGRSAYHTNLTDIYLKTGDKVVIDVSANSNATNAYIQPYLGSDPYVAISTGAGVYEFTPTKDGVLAFNNGASIEATIYVKNKYDEALENVICTYFVDASYSGASDGSQNKPFPSISAALSAAGNSKDITLRIKGGTYKEIVNISNKNRVHITRWYASDNDNPIIINNAAILNMSGVSNIKSCAYSASAGDFIYDVFVAGSQPIDPGISSAGGHIYNVNLWSEASGKRFTPVADYATMSATPDSWTYDGTNIYVNTTENNGTFIADLKLFGDYSGLYVTNVNELKIEDVMTIGSRLFGIEIHNCGNYELTRCKAFYTGRYSGILQYYSNGRLYDCVSKYNVDDGIGGQLYGNMELYNCVAEGNEGDGFSNHNYGYGAIYGGYYLNNGKGGIEPTYGAKFEIHNAMISGNRIGVSTAYSASMQNKTLLMIGAIITNNQSGFINDGYDCFIHDCYISGNIENIKTPTNGGVNYIYD